jgi:poly(3-hydroxybutyrate) depolymerase
MESARRWPRTCAFALVLAVSCSPTAPVRSLDNLPRATAVTAPARMILASGARQIATVGTTLPAQLVVQAVDAQGLGVAGVTVTWSAPDGWIEPVSTTDPGGFAAAWAGLPVLAGPSIFSAASGSLAGSPIVFDETGTPDVPFALGFADPPLTAVAATILSPAVRVIANDRFGNSTTTLSGPVQVGILANPGGATLTGTLTASATAGSASFADLSLNRASAGYTFFARAAGLSDGASTPFDVIPARGGARPSSGCGATGFVRGLSANTIVANGKTRAYLLAVPDSYNAAVPLALTFVWHARCDTGAGVRGVDLETPAAGASIFVYPDGLYLPAYDCTGWDLSNGGDDVRLFDALVQAIEARYCVDQARRSSTGFSFGGGFSNALACFRGAALRAVAPVGTGRAWLDELLPPHSSVCGGPIATWLATGSDDPYYSGAVDSRDQRLAQNHCGATSTPVPPSPWCASYNGCTAGAPLVWCVHSGLGGHVWPPFASSAVWQFLDGLP